MSSENSIRKIIDRYYNLLDNYASLEELQIFFDESFEIIEDDLYINSRDTYARWYTHVNNLFLKRQHQINSVEVDTIEDGYYILMDVTFTGTKYDKEIVCVEAKIKWHMKHTNHGLKLRRYEVIKKEG